MTGTTPLWRADAALKRARFVDREADLRYIEEHVPEPLDRPPVFLITGEGGVGKTEIFKECLQPRRAGEWKRQAWLAARDVVDFYHMETHTVDGLAAAVARQFEGSHFEGFQGKLRELNERRGQVVGIKGETMIQLERDVAEAFLADIARLAAGRPVALAFDTAERLMYEPDEFQAALGVGAEEVGVAVLPWLLKEFLPRLKNVIVFLAGRPAPETPERLFEDLRAALGDRLIERPLAGFAEAEAGEYWEAIARGAEEAGDDETARRIRVVDAATRKNIWHLSDGRPILLSLAIHHAIRTGRLLDDLRPGAGTELLEGQGLLDARRRVEVGLVREFLDRGLPEEAGIRMLAWARRGLSRGLLARLLGVGPEAAERSFAILQQMAFVKTRPEDQSLFLHDEMQRLLWENLLKHHVAERDAILAAIRDYYDEQIREIRAALERDRWYADAVVSPDERMSRATERYRLLSQLYRLMAEQVHYWLRHSPRAGFQQYYHYIKETAWANQLIAMMELRDELLLFQRELDEWAGQDDPRLRDDIVCECALRWIDRAIRRGDYDDAIATAENIRSNDRLQARFKNTGPGAEAELDLLQGRACGYWGHLTQAEQLLQDAYRIITKPEAENDAFDEWRREMLRAEILNDQGYVARQQGLLKESIGRYKEAIRLWRRIDGADSEHANTLNNYAMVLAERGRYDEALRGCFDALEMRRRLGDDGPVAYSLNTLGLIEVRNDQPHRGLGHCQQALQIFRDLRMARGIGLACTAAAEALRRQALTPEMYNPAEKRGRLDEATSLAEEAVRIFSEDVREQMRLIEARIEVGCDYRDAAHFLAGELDAPAREALHAAGVGALSTALDEMKDDASFAHKRMEAQVNWAFLEHYMGDDEKAERLLAETETRDAPPAYLLRADETRAVGEARPQPVFWMHLGKAELLRGRIAMRRFGCAGKDPEQAAVHLRAAAQHFTLALEYDRLFAPTFRDLRRGQEAIYDDLKGLNAREFTALMQGAATTAGAYGLQRPSHLEQFVEEAFGVTGAAGPGDR